MRSPARFDLHVHSRHSSDASPSVAEIAARVEALGLRGFALTDHNSAAGHSELPELRARHPGLVVVPGVEVSTRDGHLLAYGIGEAPVRDRPVDETIAWVRSHGGVPVLAHPFRFWHGVGRRVASSAAVTAIEGANGHSSVGVNRRAVAVAAARQLGTTGGSDAHVTGDIGRTWTEIEGPADSVEEVLDAIRRGAVRGAGRSPTGGETARLAFRSAVRRLRRGFRPV